MNKLSCYLKCGTGQNIPEDLEDVIEAKTEWRYAVLNIDHISLVYPSINVGETYIDMFNGSEYVIKGDYEEVLKRIS